MSIRCMVCGIRTATKFFKTPNSRPNRKLFWVLDPVNRLAAICEPCLQETLAEFHPLMAGPNIRTMDEIDENTYVVMSVLNE